jgi:hypothetical protein
VILHDASVPAINPVGNSNASVGHDGIVYR